MIVITNRVAAVAAIVGILSYGGDKGINLFVQHYDESFPTDDELAIMARTILAAIETSA